MAQALIIAVLAIAAGALAYTASGLAFKRDLAPAKEAAKASAAAAAAGAPPSASSASARRRAASSASSR